MNIVRSKNHKATTGFLVRKDIKKKINVISLVNVTIQGEDTGRSPKPPSMAGMKRFIPTYRGEANAFSIQLFCIDERYEMR